MGSERGQKSREVHGSWPLCDQNPAEEGHEGGQERDVRQGREGESDESTHGRQGIRGFGREEAVLRELSRQAAAWLTVCCASGDGSAPTVSYFRFEGLSVRSHGIDDPTTRLQ